MCFQENSFYDTQDLKNDFFTTKHYKETHTISNMADLLSEEMSLFDGEFSFYPQSMQKMLTELQNEFFVQFSVFAF